MRDWISAAVFCTAAVFAADTSAQEAASYDAVTAGSRQIVESDGISRVKILLDFGNLGGDELEMAEITFPPGTHVRGHAHRSLEVFYVLEGALTHVVGGKGAVLGPGMVGIVRPGDAVEHIVDGPEPARVLVIWAPGGEAERVFGDAAFEPIERLAVRDFPRP